MLDKRDSLKGSTHVLKNLVNYERGSVVSRTIIDKPSGTVTLFSFDKSEGLSEHTAPYDALVINLEGEADVKIEDKNNILKEGDAIIMPANKPHALKALSQFKMLLVMIKT